MLLLSAVATIVALGIAGIAIFGVLERFVTQGLDRRLDAELSLLATAVDAQGTIDRARLRQIHAGLENGPEWRWRIVSPRDTIASADFPVIDPMPAGPPDRPGRQGAHPAEGRDREGARLHARSLTMPSAIGPVTLAAAAPWQVVSRPIRGALVPLLVTLGLLGLALGSAAIVQLRIGLRPLRSLRDGLAAIRNGRSSALDEDQPDELRPLAIELNALIRENAAALETARASAANLAHALKTPVATLALEMRDEPARAAQVDRIYATIRHHLARARGGLINRRAATPLAPAIADMIAAVARLHADRGIAISQAIPPDVVVAIDAADLDDLAGNLIDNAARHARATVAIAAEVHGMRVRLSVVDDGPGIAAADRARATDPGIRLDEQGEGDGFGLAIARELAALYGGSLLLEEAEGGGLRATIELVRCDRGDGKMDDGSR